MIFLWWAFCVLYSLFLVGVFFSYWLFEGHPGPRGSRRYTISMALIEIFTALHFSSAAEWAKLCMGVPSAKEV